MQELVAAKLEVLRGDLHGWIVKGVQAALDPPQVAVLQIEVRPFEPVARYACDWSLRFRGGGQTGTELPALFGTPIP